MVSEDYTDGLTRSAAGLTWEGCLPRASEETVAALERILGVTLPSDYLDVAQRCHGGEPQERSSFIYEQSPGGDFGSGLALLLSLDSQMNEGIVTTMRNLAVDDQLQAGLIPVATDGGGDYICLDYR